MQPGLTHLHSNFQPKSLTWPIYRILGCSNSVLSPPKPIPCPVSAPWLRGSSSWCGRAGQRCRQQSETRRDAHGEASRPPRASRRAGGTGLVAGREQKKGTSAPGASQLPATDAPRSGAAVGAGITRPGALRTPQTQGGCRGSGALPPRTAPGADTHRPCHRGKPRTPSNFK